MLLSNINCCHKTPSVTLSFQKQLFITDKNYTQFI